MFVDKADSLLTGFWGDEHDDTQIVAVCHRLHDVEIVLEGQVGDNGTAHTTLGTTLAEGLDAVV